MIKVIKEGKKPSEIVYRASCGCGCIFNYQKEDVQSYSDPRESWTTVKCPTCGIELTHKESNKLPAIHE